MTTQTFAQEIGGGEYVADPIHSSVGFAVRHNGVSVFRGGFGSYAVRLTGGDSPRLEGTVEVGSVQVDDPQLRGHLLSPEFFDAERHPRLRFESSELRVAEDGALVVHGELEIHGRTHRVEAVGRLAGLGEDISGGRRVGISLGATVDRRSFGLDWQAALPSGGEVLGNDVQIEAELELVEEEA
ncbi:MAG TPA: YceI family protein [Solirubrobacterales bacterium]|jgi:polyisoprenoid-binding protein YceI